MMPISAPRCLASAAISSAAEELARNSDHRSSELVQRQHIEFVWHGENQMKVARTQEFLLPRSEPAFARLRLALGTVPVAARVIRDGLMTAARARRENLSNSRSGSRCRAHGWQL